MPFQNLSSFALIRVSAPFTAAQIVSGIINGVAVAPGNKQVGGLHYTVTISPATSALAGTINPVLQGSVNGGVTFISLDSTYDLGVLATAGTRNLELTGPMPPLLRWTYTVSAAFNGRVETRLYSSGRIQGIGVDR